jgi:hypothetical protein
MKGFLFFISLTTIVSVLVSCGTNTVPVDFDGDPIVEQNVRPHVNELKSEMKDMVYPDVMELELYRSGETYICNEPEFLSCVNITKDQCTSEARTYIHDCITSSKEAQGKVVGKAGAKRLAGDFSVCLAYQFMGKRDKSAIEQCLNNSAQP